MMIYKANVIKTVWCQCVDRQREEWKRVESPVESGSMMYDHAGTVDHMVIRPLE